MLSNLSRRLTYLLALLYLILGAALFAFPEALAPVFAWNVTPFMTMTIGGWCLGNAWAAWATARRWQWSLVYSTLLYLWIFGTFQMNVVIAFRDKLQMEHPIAWFYLAALGVNCAAVLVGIVEWLRDRPPIQGLGRPVTRLMRTLITVFMIFVALLAIYGVFSPDGRRGTDGSIFPEPMTLFTLRSFAVFYLSLSLGTVPLIFAKGLNVVQHHIYAAYAFLIMITIPALVYIHLFDFSTRPGGIFYIGTYVFVAVATAVMLVRGGTGKAEQAGN